MLSLIFRLINAAAKGICCSDETKLTQLVVCFKYETRFFEKIAILFFRIFSVLCGNIFGIAES